MAGINGENCSFVTIEAALNSAVDRNKVITRPRTHSEFGLKINGAFEYKVPGEIPIFKNGFEG